jgi:hypothetical protein
MVRKSPSFQQLCLLQLRLSKIKTSEKGFYAELTVPPILAETEAIPIKSGKSTIQMNYSFDH